MVSYEQTLDWDAFPQDAYQPLQWLPLDVSTGRGAHRVDRPRKGHGTRQ